MKRFICLLASVLTLVSCYDDGPIWDELQDHESRIAALETLCAQMNTNISSIQTIVTALQAKDYVTAVAPIKEGDKIIGYTITFNKAGSVTVYNGTDGTSSSAVPVIGVEKDSDGVYYWTIDGEWLLDENGNKVNASGADGAAGTDGRTPQIDLKEGYWWVSYDGKEWTKLGVASGLSNLVDVRFEGSYVYLALDDDTVLMIPMNIGVPEMTVESGCHSFIFKGKAVPVSPDYVVGVFVHPEEGYEEGMKENLIWGIEDADAFAYEFTEEGSFTLASWVGDGEGLYYYLPFVYANGVMTFGELTSVTFTPNTAGIIYDVTDITEGSAKITGKIELLRPADVLVYLETWPDPMYVKPDSDGGFQFVVTGLRPDTDYEFRIGVDYGGEMAEDEEELDVVCFTTANPYEMTFDLDAEDATDLSSSETANCYVVSSAGLYKFKAVKGNDASLTLSGAASASILWESFGTSEEINHLDLLAGVEYEDGYVLFKTSETFKPGNAVVAVKDADGKILWSWHIWLTSQILSQTYYVWDHESGVFTDEVAGVMMDRNLGATMPASSGMEIEDVVKSFGLLYQWGRKDPFLGTGGGSIITKSGEDWRAVSTMEWPDVEYHYDSSIDFVTEHPTTFIVSDDNWLSQPESDLWSSVKTVYDPCPAGWRVPDGEKIWWQSGFDSNRYGMINYIYSFAGSSSFLSYPVAGILEPHSGRLNGLGYGTDYWSADNQFNLDLYWDNMELRPIPSAAGASVRCMKDED